MVSKVGASGGGKAYKKNRPINYYGALAVIVVLGMASVILARYDYQNPVAASAGTPPAIGTTWFSVVNFDICGVNESLLQSDPTYKGGFTVAAADGRPVRGSVRRVGDDGRAGATVAADDVIRISPVSAADAGNNATVGQFALEYPGLVASSSQLAIPLKDGVATAASTYHNGELCPKGSAYANKPGQIEYAYWRTFAQSTPTITTNPSTIKFSNEMELTMAFVPKGVTPARPTSQQVSAMVLANTASAVTTTTTASSVTTTTTPSSTTSTTSSTTTTTTPKG